MAELDIRKCTSKTFKKKDEKGSECGVPLLYIKPINDTDPAWICPDCDGLEYLPKKTRERIFEQ
jgi:hypothetical protein